MSSVLVGMDPELFVRNESGVFVSGHDLCPGTKYAPFPVADGTVQVDGLALEIGITPAETKDQFRERLFSVWRDLEGFLPEGYTLQAIPTAHFTREYLMSLPRSVLRLGCEPDFCAYTLAENPRPNGRVTFRTGAGHIHVGFIDEPFPRSAEHMSLCASVVKNLDWTVGVPSLLWDKDVKRRTLYGRAGAFRPKHYGLEYRTPSNAWLNDARLVDFVYDSTLLAVELSAAEINLCEVLGDADHYINNSVFPSGSVLSILSDYVNFGGFDGQLTEQQADLLYGS